MDTSNPAEKDVSRRRFWIPRFTMQQMFMLMLLFGLVLALVTNARQQQPAQAFIDIAFSPDNSRIALGGNENTQVFDVKTRRLIATFPLSCRRYTGGRKIVFVDNDTIVQSSYGGTKWGVGSGVFRCSVTDPEIERLYNNATWNDSISICKEGYAVVDTKKSSIKFFPFDSQKPTINVNSGLAQNSHERIHVSDSGRYLTLVSGHFQFRAPWMLPPAPYSLLIDLESPSFSGEMLGNNMHSEALLDANEQNLLLADSSGARLLDWESEKVLWEYEFGAKAENSRFTKDGKLVAVYSNVDIDLRKNDSNRFVAILNAETGEEIFRIDVNDRLQSAFEFSPDGKTIVVADATDHFGGAQLWDIASEQMIGSLGSTKRIHRLVLFPLMIVVWTLAWTRSKNKRNHDLRDPSSHKKTGRNKFVAWILITFGCGIIFWFSAICFFTMSETGNFGQLPFQQQTFATAVVCSLNLLGVWLTVIGIRRIKSR